MVEINKGFHMVLILLIESELLAGDFITVFNFFRILVLRSWLKCALVLHRSNRVCSTAARMQSAVAPGPLDKSFFKGSHQ